MQRLSALTEPRCGVRSLVSAPTWLACCDATAHCGEAGRAAKSCKPKPPPDDPAQISHRQKEAILP
jgi:hypothetical protein